MYKRQVLIRPELDLWEPGEHNGTFRGYQLSMIAAKAGLEVMLNEHVEELSLIHI